MTIKEIEAEALIGGKSWSMSAGKFALQADGSVAVRVGDTVVMATAVMTDKPREGIDYLPLLVDYEEKLYAAGKIKGSRWVKREGRPSDDAILSGRVIDRSLRPMFDLRIRNDIQVVVTVLSADQENDPDIIGLNAAAAAIEVSNIPWGGPVAGVRVGKINGQFVTNPSFEQVEKESDLDLIVSGTENHIIMVEAGAKEIPEEEMIAAVEYAQAEIKKLVALIKDLGGKAGRTKREVKVFEPEAGLREKFSFCRDELAATIFEAETKKRETALTELRGRITEELAGEDEALKLGVNYLFDEAQKEIIQENILEHERRADGRKLDEIREIACEVGLLPRVHGSGLFRRGETQVLTTATLGGPGDIQLLEDIETEEERKKRYMHHYNMPGFASGEVSPMRSPGRREIGHGALAERALVRMIPPQESFPYTLRLVSEVLSSNGSTSMASTCGSTLALMDAGVPIKAPVSGIAMGLVMDKKTGGYKILTDILGMEDGNGHMDFKVAGTANGITALQLDIKVKGLTVEILRSALAQALKGRLFILEKMLAVIAAPRPELSRYAPRIISFKIKPEKIREVIGPAGKTINEIIAATGVKIDIEDDGTVMITSTNGENSQKAVEWVKNLVREVGPGEEFDGKVTRIMDFGAFVEVLPGKEGLVHVSELANYRVGHPEDVVKIGDKLKVKVTEIDEQGRINLTHRPFAEPGKAPYDSAGPRAPRPPMRGRGFGGRRPHRNFPR